MGNPHMITLYEHPLSPYAMKVKIALAEKGIKLLRAPCAYPRGKTAGYYGAGRTKAARYANVKSES